MLSVSEAVSSSFTDSRATLMTYRKALYICLALAALAGLLGIFFALIGQRQIQKPIAPINLARHWPAILYVLVAIISNYRQQLA